MSEDTAAASDPRPVEGTDPRGPCLRLLAFRLYALTVHEASQFGDPLPGQPRADVFEAVFVCTGNRARSVLAEALFRRYSVGVPTVISSAGTLDVGPLPPLEHAIRAGRRLGVDLRGHRARGIRTVSLAGADLVLGFEPAHVAEAVACGGASGERTFLLGELLMLLGGNSREQDPVVRARAEITEANARRIQPLPHSAAMIIADPLGKPARVMQRTAAEIDGLVRRLVFGLFGELPDPLPEQRRA